MKIWKWSLRIRWSWWNRNCKKKSNYFESDIDVLKIAIDNDLILVTEDKDFGELVYRLKYPHCGIVLIRIKDISRKERIELAAKTIYKYEHELKNNFSIITKNGIKIKKS